MVGGFRLVAAAVACAGLGLLVGGGSAGARSTLFMIKIDHVDAANGSATVYFSVTNVLPQSPVRQYTVNTTQLPAVDPSIPGAITGSSSPITVNGLQNGETYIFIVSATDTAGETPPPAMGQATVMGAPGPPTAVAASAGDTIATISFSYPSDAPSVTSYTVRASPDGAWATQGSSPITVRGLKDGTSYTFTVTARNAFGDSFPSATSNTVTPAAVAVASTSGVAAATAVTDVRVKSVDVRARSPVLSVRADVARSCSLVLTLVGSHGRTLATWRRTARVGRLTLSLPLPRSARSPGHDTLRVAAAGGRPVTVSVLLRA